MQTKTIKIGEKEFKIKEISLDDSLELSGIKDAKEATKKILQLAVEPPLLDEDRKNLSMREGLQLIEEINKLNGLEEGFLSTPKTQNIESGK